MTIRLFLITCLSIFSIVYGKSQTAIDLQSALKYAVEHHAAIRNAQLDVAIGKQQIREAMSSGLPQVSANGSILNNLALRTSLVPAEFLGGQPGEFARLQFGTNWNANAGFQLHQIVFDKSWLLGLQATRELADFYKLSLEKSKEEVIYEVAKLYFQIQLNRTQQGILKANLSQIEGLLKVTTLQYENGFAKKIDVDRLAVQQSNLTTQLSNLDLQIEQLEQALKFAMQMPLDTEIILTDTISEEMEDAVNPSIVQPSYTQRPGLKLLNKQQELYNLNERRWKAGYFPSLNLFANYTYEWQANNIDQFGNGQNWTDYSQVGLQIQVPIFDGFLKDSRIQTAQLNAQKVGNQYQQALLGTQLEHESAVTAIRLQQNNLESVKKTREVAEEVYRVTQSRYSEGVAPITELLDAETSMREAQSNYITTLAQLKLAEIDLLHANGKLLNMLD